MADSAVADAPPVSVKEPEDNKPELKVPEVKPWDYALIFHTAVLAVIALAVVVCFFVQAWDIIAISLLTGVWWACVGQGLETGHGGYLKRHDGYIYPWFYGGGFYINLMWPYAIIKDVPLEPRSDAVGVAKVNTLGSKGVLGLEIGVQFKGTYVIDLSVPYDDGLQPRAVIQNSGDMRDEAISACKRALSNVGGKLKGASFVGQQEALALMVECDLRLADRPDEYAPVPFLTDAERALWCEKDGSIKPEFRLSYYDRHAVSIRRRLKKKADDSLSKGEEDWAFSAYGFTVTEFDFPDSMKEVAEVDQKTKAGISAVQLIKEASRVYLPGDKLPDEDGPGVPTGEITLTDAQAWEIYQLQEKQILKVIAQGGDLAGFIAAVKSVGDTFSGKKGGK